MAINLNAELTAFKAFADSNVSANKAAQLGEGNAVTTAEGSASWLSRKLNVTQNAGNVRTANNQVRDALVTALKAQFGVATFDALPESVRAALKGSHASSAAGDFGFDANEQATSGRPLTKRRISAVIQAAIDQIKSDEMSYPRAAISAEGCEAVRQLILDMDSFFTCTYAESFRTSELDLPRGQETRLGGKSFGGKKGFAPKQSTAYRAHVKKSFGGDEGMIRVFNGIANQGTVVSLFAGRLHDGEGMDTSRKAMAMSPFVPRNGGKKEQDYSYTVTNLGNQRYRMDASFIQHGNVAMTEDGTMHPVDMKKSFNFMSGSVIFAKVDAGTPGAITKNYTGEDGLPHSITFTLEVPEVISELKIAALA